MKKKILGEFIGTFILVLFGCGSVAVAVLYQNLNLYQIASIWAFAVAAGIYASRKLSKSHLNPAVTLGFWIFKDINTREVLPYIIGQFFGAVFAGIALYFIFAEQITLFEAENTIIRGYEASKQTAMMFGEFYPNPGNDSLTELSTTMACLFEGLGTFALMFGILVLVHIKSIPENLLPVLIGLLVGTIIVFVAPYTQAGLNPARDFGPRLVSYFAGWKEVAFSLPNLGWLTVYILTPIAGSIIASVCYRKLKKT